MFHSLVALLVLSAPVQLPATDAPRPHESLLLSGASKKKVRVEVPGLEIEGRASYDLNEQHLTIDWVYEVLGLTSGAMYDPTKSSSLQTISLDFWPTEVASPAPLQLVVAGRNRFGETIVQVIALQAPTALPGLAIDPATGRGIVPRLELRIASRRTAFRRSAESSELIAALFANRGRPGEIFAYFHTSRRLAAIELATGALSYVAVSVGPAEPGTLVIPALAADYAAVDDGEHAAEGHLYWLYDSDKRTQPVLLLRDSDKDGQLDGFELVTNWGTRGDATRFVSLR